MKTTLDQDRRITPRLPCHLAVANKGVVIGEVHDVSLGGIRVSTTSQLLQNYLYDFQLIIPSSKQPIGFQGRVIFKLGDSYGIRIEKISGKAKRYFEKYVVYLRESCQIRDIISNLKNNKNTLVIEDKKEIKRLIEKSIADGLGFKISLVDFYQPLSAIAISVGEESFRIKLKTRIHHLRAANLFYCVVMISYHSYYFQANFESEENGHLICSLPRQIFFSDRRREGRLTFEKENVKVAIKGPLDSEIEGRLIDYSTNGARIRVLKNCGLFFLRTPLEYVKLNNVRGVKKAIVRSVREPAGNYQEVGLQFIDEIRSEDFTVNPVTHFKRGNLLDKYAKKAANAVSFLLHKVRPTRAIQTASTSFRPVTFNNTLGQKVAALLDTSFDINEKVKTPMIIVIPAWGSKKESFSALAAVITHNFREKGQPIAVLRFDMTNHLGESYKDPESQEVGKESLNITPKSILSDISGVVRFAKDNPLVSVNQIIFISFSFSGPLARRIILEDGGHHVKYWVNAMGSADLAEIMRSVSGGIDYIANYKKGTRLGVISFYGVTANVDNFCESAIELGLDSYVQAKHEFPLLPIPVTSIYGKYDGWIDPNHVRELAGLKSAYPRDLIEMPSGHLPKTTDEALENFEVITNKVFHFIHGREIVTATPSVGYLMKKAEGEKARVRREEVADVRQYWENYMVGGEKDLVGYDILEYSPDYRRFVELQKELLDLKQHQVFCDLGCGTGLFEKIALAGNHEGVPSKIILTDFVDRVLERARRNLAPIAIGTDVSFQRIDLNLSDEIVLNKFRQGRYSSIESLKGRQKLLSDTSIEKLLVSYDELVHAFLIGDLELPQTDRYVRIYGNECWTEIERMHSYFKGGESADLVRNKGNLNIPIESNSLDRVLISIVLPYVVHPLETIAEIFRILKLGGLVVASTMRKDSEFSRIFKNTLKSIESQTQVSENKETLLNHARAFMNEAAQLWRLTEEDVFSFFTPDEFKLHFELNGFHDIVVSKGYGDPEQAIIVRATKPFHQG